MECKLISMRGIRVWPYVTLETSGVKQFFLFRRSDDEEKLRREYKRMVEGVIKNKNGFRVKNKTSRIAKAVVGGVLVGGLAVVSAPPALSAAGFSAGGIVAGSLAAKLMSAAAIANGGGVAAASAGGWIAAAQSAGAGGIGFFSNLLLSVGVGTAWTFVLSKKSKLKKEAEQFPLEDFADTEHLHRVKNVKLN